MQQQQKQQQKQQQQQQQQPLLLVMMVKILLAISSKCPSYRDEGAVEATKVVVGGVAEEGRAENGDCRESTAQERS